MDNYFGLFGLKVGYHIDKTQLEERYIELISAGSLDSKEVNLAYKTLNSELLRAEYLLAMENIIINKTNSTHQPNQETLLEIMDFRENLASENLATDKQTAFSLVQDRIKQAEKDLSEAFLKNDTILIIQNAIRLKYYSKTAEDVKNQIHNDL